jgi:holo-[acyl-carrier protein] synthase
LEHLLKTLPPEQEDQFPHLADLNPDQLLQQRVEVTGQLKNLEQERQAIDAELLGVFTDAERTWAGASRHPEQRLAARFAAKEAVLKALGAGLGSAPLTDIEVVRGTSGAPSVALHGRAAELARSLGVDRVLVSLTHTSTTAAAFAVAMGGADPGAGAGAGAGVRVRRSGSLDGDHA